MGVLDRIFSRGAQSREVVAQPLDQQRPADDPFQFEVQLGEGQPLVQLSGTTTIGEDAMARLAVRHGIQQGGYLETAAVLQRETTNPIDPGAVAVHVEGERVGYLPGYIAHITDLSELGGRTVTVQIFAELVPKGLRVEAWAWLGTGEPQWQWSATSRPPMSPRAKAEAHHASITDMVTGALAEGGPRADQLRAGMVNGVHYLQTVEPIKQVKRDGRLEDALAMCQAAIEGAVGDAAASGLMPAPWYTEQAAIICRKLGRFDKEREVLEQWVAACPPKLLTGESPIEVRLNKIRASGA